MPAKGAKCEDNVAGLHIARQSAGELRSRSFPYRRTAQLLHRIRNQGRADSRDRLLPRRIQISEVDKVGVGKGLGELAVKVTRARVKVRLKCCNDGVVEVGPSRRFQCCLDLGRMMCVVVYDRDSAHLTNDLKAALQSYETVNVDPPCVVRISDARSRASGECTP